MILKEINFSTGPVALHEKVKLALIEDPISHRCKHFDHLIKSLLNFYKDEFHVNDVYFLTGSGTTANEAMIHQVKMLNKPGLVLNNGEFGNRLVKQCITNGLDFSILKKEYGERFSIDEIEQAIYCRDVEWLLFTHCETSSGIINDLENLVLICRKHNVLCFVDCISSVGAFKIDLSQIAMATASSGKGLCGIPGIGIVFSNMETTSNGKIPVSLDLTNYSSGKIPFTISSNVLSALYAGSKLKLNTENYRRIGDASRKLTQIFEYNYIKTFSAQSHVFTIISTHSHECNWLAKKLLDNRVTISDKSEYLQKNNWLQVALLGIYTDCDMLEGLNRIQALLSGKVVNQVHLNMNAIQ